MMVLPLAACGAKSIPNAEEAYTKMQEKSAAVEKMDADVNMTLSMSEAEPEDPENPQAMEIKVSGEVLMDQSDDKIVFAAPMFVDMMGYSVPFNYYYADGYLMFDFLGQNGKIPMDLDEAMDSLLTSELTGTKSLELIKDLKIEAVEQEDKKAKSQYLLSYSMDSAALTDMLKSLEQFDLDATGESVQWNKVAGTILIDEDYNALSQTVTASFIIDDPYSGKILVEMNSDVVYKEITDDFAVDTPDPADYYEMETGLYDEEDLFEEELLEEELPAEETPAA